MQSLLECYFQELQELRASVDYSWHVDVCDQPDCIRTYWFLCKSNWGCMKDEVVGLGMSERMCGQGVLVDSVSYPYPAAFLHVETVGQDSQEDSMEPPRFSVDSLYDASISAREEDEILTELASFLPCQEENRRTDGRQSHHVFVYRQAIESAVLLDPPCLPSEDVVESGVGSLQSHSGYPMEPWNYDMCNIDSTSSSPGKELTFVNLSKDKSIPPTPIKEWTSRKREPLEIAPEGPPVWTWEDGDLVNLPASPTKEWASPTVKCKEVISSKSIVRDESPLPPEWFSDLDRSEFPQSCWDATDTMSTFPVASVRKGAGMYLNSSHPCTEALDTSCKLQLSPSDFVVGTLEFECMESPPHQTKVWIIANEGDALHNTPVSVEDTYPLHNTPVSTEDSEGGLHNSPVSIKKIAYALPNSADSTEWKSIEGVDSFDVSTPAKTDVVTNCLPRDSPPTPAMEEELLDELAKLFRGSPDPAVASSKISRSAADSLTGSLRERPVKKSTKLSKSKYRSKFIEPILGRESSLSKSAKKLEFILEDGGDGHEGNLGIGVPNCFESCNVMAKESRLESYGPLSPRSAATLQAADKMFDRFKVVEANGNTAGPRFPSKIRKEACYDGFNLEKHVNGTMPDHISDGYATEYSECLRGSPWGVCDEMWGEELNHTPFVEEGDFCDKAVDGNIVTSPTSMHQAKDVLIDRLCPSFTDWQTKPDEEKLKPPSKSGMVSLSFDRNTDHVVSWPDSNSTVRGEKGCNFVERQSDIARTNIGTQPCLIHKRDIIHDPISNSEDRLDAAAEAPSELAGGRDMAISCRIGCTGHSPHHLKSTSSDTSSALLSKQERSSSMSVSRKYFLQSPSMRLQRRGCDSDSESVTSTANVHPAMVEDLFENLGQRGPTEYGRASFAYEELSTSRLDEDGSFETMLKHRDMRRLWAPENLSGPLLLTCGSEANSSFRRAQPTPWDGLAQATGAVTHSLQDLCKLWDEECVDLLTRSLKYKSLMTDPNLLSREVSQAYDKPGSTSPQAIAFEIQNIERLLEKFEDRESHKELVKQQRDNIYINIATNATMRERYRLYSNWGIRRMSRGRLRKVIYELLWKDPKRYHASADLVLQYL